MSRPVLDLSIAPTDVAAYHLEAPLSRPRRNAFGEMRSRPALLVRLEDASGAEGWGEAFCNWPSFAAPHRARILEEILAPLCIGARFATPAHLSAALEDAVRLLKLQCDEPGPFDQSIAALDLAAWDLAARRAGRPLGALLSERPAADVPVYASALTAGTIDALVPPLVEAGWRGFKIKVGFGLAADLAGIDALRALVGPNAAIMVDANQRWTPGEAIAFGRAAAGRGLVWLEEPLPADAPAEHWARIAQEQPVPIAAGENLRGTAAFADAVTQGGVAYVQPDVIKWGGVSAMRRIADDAAANGARIAPHYLGGGVGLAATAHVAAALGADWLEVDVTENPLREAFSAGAIDIQDGVARPSDAPGFGPAPDQRALARHAAA